MSRTAHGLALACASLHALICAGLAAYTASWMLWLTIAVPAVVVPAMLVLKHPDSLLTRLAMAAGFMSLTALIIEQSGSDMEAHFSFFIMISILVVYHDWRVLVFALALILLHHLMFTLLQARTSAFLIWSDGRNIWGHFAVHCIAASIQTAALSYLGLILRDRFGLARRNVQLDQSLTEAALRASCDPLTGLFNRRYLDEVVRQIGISPDGSRRLATLCVIDLDHFKAINDRHGHSAGDAVLRDVSAVIRDNLGVADFAVRYGGEEFLVVLRDPRPGTGITFAECVRRELEGRQTQQHLDVVGVTASFGLSRWQENEVFADAFARADRAVYRAKSLGRNRVELDSGMEQSERPILATVTDAFAGPPTASPVPEPTAWTDAVDGRDRGQALGWLERM